MLHQKNQKKNPKKQKPKTFSDMNHISVTLGLFPKTIEIKTKINKWDLTKLIIFCTVKETVNKMKTTYGL